VNARKAAMIFGVFFVVLEFICNKNFLPDKVYNEL